MTKRLFLSPQFYDILSSSHTGIWDNTNIIYTDALLTGVKYSSVVSKDGDKVEIFKKGSTTDYTYGFIIEATPKLEDTIINLLPDNILISKVNVITPGQFNIDCYTVIKST